MRTMPAHVLEGLDPEQRLVAEALTGPVVVLAGAGTGKTRAITHRIAHAVQTGTHAPGNGLAVTFTNRAAGEMRQRLAQLGVPSVAVRTFHAAALSQLRYFWPTAVGGQFPDLIASKAALVGQACREIGLPSGRPLVRDLAAEIEWAGSTMVSTGDYATAAAAAGRTPVGSGDNVIDLPGIARVMSAYQDVKSQVGAIDFEDVLLLMVALIGDRPDIADAIRAQYRWFTVDEYQDITPVQDQLLSAWLGERDDVCVVGDASQTIYSFAGASPDALGQFARRWPNATEVRLDRCYRCTPEIVAAANAVIAGTGPESGPGTAVWLRSQRPTGVAPEVVACADDAEEAASVAARINDLVASGYAHRDIAVLMRTNAASEPIEVAFAEADIPYVMRGTERFFDRPEVREAIVRMRGHAVAGGGRRKSAAGKGGPGRATAASAVDRAGSGSASAVDRAGGTAASEGVAVSPDPPAGVPDPIQIALEMPPPAAPARTPTSARATTGDTGNGLVEQTRAVLAGMGWLSTGPASGGATRERWESLAAVLALAEEVAASGATTMGELVEEFERRAQLSHAPTADGVTITTLHSAKGLEWPVVFIIGASEGNLPIVYAETAERIEEERRLFYVGVTRAQDRLVITWSLMRPGSGRQRQASRFLASMRTRRGMGEQAVAAGLVRQGRSGATKEHVRGRSLERCRVCGAGLVTGRERTLGRCLRCPGAPDEQLAASLHQWRELVAAEQGVPASIVLTDEALVAVEERRPATEADLRDIPGFRPDKITSYGSRVLALVAEAGTPEAAEPGEAQPQAGLPEPD
jgi:DNA helicase-2/ATP-dependent DNA helicase PcrA